MNMHWRLQWNNMKAQEAARDAGMHTWMYQVAPLKDLVSEEMLAERLTRPICHLSRGVLSPFHHPVALLGAGLSELVIVMWPWQLCLRILRNTVTPFPALSFAEPKHSAAAHNAL